MTGRNGYTRAEVAGQIIRDIAYKIWQGIAVVMFGVIPIVGTISYFIGWGWIGSQLFPAIMSGEVMFALTVVVGIFWAWIL